MNLCVFSGEDCAVALVPVVPANESAWEEDHATYNQDAQTKERA